MVGASLGAGEIVISERGAAGGASVVAQLLRPKQNNKPHTLRRFFPLSPRPSLSPSLLRHWVMSFSLQPRPVTVRTCAISCRRVKPVGAASSAAAANGYHSAVSSAKALSVTENKQCVFASIKVGVGIGCQVSGKDRGNALNRMSRAIPLLPST